MKEIEENNGFKRPLFKSKTKRPFRNKEELKFIINETFILISNCQKENREISTPR